METDTFLRSDILRPHIEISTPIFLRLALNICRRFQQLHDTHLSHQHISPKTVFISTNLTEVLVQHIYPAIPFTTSHELSHQGVPGAHDSGYISPEQRLRIAKTIDFRSDIYSLGMVFYFLLTNLQPISDETGCPLLYYPDSLDIPQNIKDILSKMTARFPEDRYQSLTGVMNDIHTISQSQTNLFFPGLNDTPEHLYDARHLFGRETEIEMLHSLLKESHSMPVITLSGEAGVGKTTLIQNVISQLYHLNRPLVYVQAHSIQHMPFPTLSKIVSSLASLIITEKNAQLWSKRIHQHLHSHTHLIATNFPELQSLLFCDTDHVSSYLNQDQNKLFYAYSELFKLLVQHTPNVLIILDDAQWISKSETELVNTFIARAHSSTRIIICYRQSEAPSHLRELINTIPHHNIPLFNLDTNKVSEWLTSQFNTLPKDCSPFSQRLFLYTQGNPHKIKTTLTKLNKRQRLTFQKGIRKWIFNLNSSYSIA